MGSCTIHLVYFNKKKEKCLPFFPSHLKQLNEFLFQVISVTRIPFLPSRVDVAIEKLIFSVSGPKMLEVSDDFKNVFSFKFYNFQRTEFSFHEIEFTAKAAGNNLVLYFFVGLDTGYSMVVLPFANDYRCLISFHGDDISVDQRLCYTRWLGITKGSCLIGLQRTA